MHNIEGGASGNLNCISVVGSADCGPNTSRVCTESGLTKKTNCYCWSIFKDCETNKSVNGGNSCGMCF